MAFGKGHDLNERQTQQNFPFTEHIKLSKHTKIITNAQSTGTWDDSVFDK